jgi:flagellar hook assembly protein FlgD
VRLAVFDVQGRRVALLRDGILAAGSHTFNWDGTDDHGRAVARGLYFARLECAGSTRTIKMSLAR